MGPPMPAARPGTRKPRKQVSFTMKLRPPVSRGAMVPVVLPPRVLAALGGGRARIPVAGTADGKPIRTSASRKGGAHLFPFTKEMQAATGKGPGDTVRLVLRRGAFNRALATRAAFAVRHARIIEIGGLHPAIVLLERRG